MSYQDDKRELLKLKQGIIDESESIKEEEKPTYELHGRKKVANFFYHYKWHVIVITFFVVVAGFFFYEMFSKEAGDIRVLLVAKDGGNAASLQYKSKDFEHAFEQYCPNFDDNGYVHTDVLYIDLSDNLHQDYMVASVTKLVGEVNFGEAQMFVIDKTALDDITKEESGMDGFVDLSARYPDCPYIDGVTYKIKGSGFDTLAGYVEACPSDLYIVIREVGEYAANKGRAERSQARALQVMDNIVSGKLAGWEFEESRIYKG